MVFYCDKNTENGGGVGRTLHNFGQELTLGHVYDLRYVGKYMHQHRNIEKNG